jgi:hypothetical protein
MNDVESIAKLLASDVGYAIDLFGGMLSVRNLEDGRFEVAREVRRKPDLNRPSRRRTTLCEQFAEPREAAIRFVELRIKFKVGFDFEREESDAER